MTHRTRPYAASTYAPLGATLTCAPQTRAHPPKGLRPSNRREPRRSEEPCCATLAQIPPVSARSTCPTGNGRARTITRPPRWLSTDLRDGNQALIDPMDAEKKTRFFDLLVKIGLKEIEVGFPAAGATEFDFISRPGPVGPRARRRDGPGADPIAPRPDQDHVRKPARARQAAIVHLYNAVSPAWRKIVFGMSRDEIKEIAVDGAKVLRDQAAAQPADRLAFRIQPETFSTAELDFAVEVCEAVMDVLRPTPEQPIILNLPATVEAATPNIYADQIEYFGRNIPNRDSGGDQPAHA